MIRRYSLFVAAMMVCGYISLAPARAAIVDYNITFTSNTGGGTSVIGMFSADDVTDVVSAIMFDLTGLNAPNNVPLDTRTFLTVNGPWTFTGGPAGLTIPFSIGLDPTITAAVSVDGFARFTADLFGNYTFDVFDGPNAGGVGSDSGTYTVMQKVSTVPLPAALPLFGTVLGLMGLAGWWRRRRTQVAAA